MKKFLIIILALALVMSLSVPAFAENETSGQTNLTFTYSSASPTYTVTIPATLTLTVGDNLLPITVSDTADLEGKEVIVTFDSTQQNKSAYSDAVIQHMGGGSNNYFVEYDVYDSNNSKISDTHPSEFVVIINKDAELAKFAVDGTKNIKLVLHNKLDDGRPIPVGIAFTGYIRFGIALG